MNLTVSPNPIDAHNTLTASVDEPSNPEDRIFIILDGVVLFDYAPPPMIWQVPEECRGKDIQVQLETAGGSVKTVMVHVNN